MRAEEMLLIQAEAMAMGGNLGGGKSLLENWVKTYRDPSYSCAATTPEAFQSEIWWQRRVELWGEGHAYTDIMRLKKNLVRCTTDGKSDFPDAWAFNIAATDGILLMRIPTGRPTPMRLSTLSRITTTRVRSLLTAAELV